MTSRKYTNGLICRCLQVCTSEHRMAVRARDGKCDGIYFAKYLEQRLFAIGWRPTTLIFALKPVIIKDADFILQSPCTGSIRTGCCV